MTPRPGNDLLRSLGRVDGWFTIGLVALICATLAWSLDDALLVLGRDPLTDFLMWAALGGAAAGIIGALVGWGRWTTHLIGATFGVLAVALMVGFGLDPEGGTPSQAFVKTAEAVAGAWTDLVIENQLSTLQYGHHLLVLGLFTWASSQFAGYAAFGHRRPMNAVVVIGLLLLANMSLTIHDQLTFLVIFSVASLFLLVRFHTLDEQADWLRRRIGDPTAISALYLRGGTVFIIAAIAGSLILTGAASSAPLAGAWTDVGARVIEWGQVLERFLPASRSGRSLGPSFGDASLIGSVWRTNDQLQLRVQYPADEERPPFLAAAIYDRFELGGWRRTDPAEIVREADTPILAGTGDEVAVDGRRRIVTTIQPAYARREIFVPGTPDSVDQRARVRLIGESGFLAGIERDPSSAPYTVTTLVAEEESGGGVTQERLRAAGTDYPDEIEALYGTPALPSDALGPASRGVLEQILASQPSDNPYDLAVAVRDWLVDPGNFRYDTEVAPCTDSSVVECFAVSREGFCQYYATMMAVFLREIGIPARYVEGYVPGPLGADGWRTITGAQAHAWVQVYFPGFGWVDFDPTGGGPPRELAPIPVGQPVPSASAGASPGGSAGLPALPSLRRDIDEPGGSVNPAQRQQTPAGLFIGIAILLAVIVGSIAAVAYRRGPRGPISADDAYGSVARLAARLGFGPRPTQTVYEYAGALADELPMVRPELETVARAKVEVAYGARALADERLASIRDAHRRLRVQLLRLISRRRSRQGRWRR